MKAPFGKGLNQLWRDCTGDPMSVPEVQSSIDACMALMPSDDEPWISEQAAANDAVAATAYALRCRHTGLARAAAWAARQAYDALDEEVMSQQNVAIISARTEDLVLRHPAIQRELGRQHRDLRDLLGTADIRQASTTIRLRAVAESTNFFDAKGLRRALNELD